MILLRTLSRTLWSVALIPMPAAAADVTGHWTFEGEVSGNAVQMSCDLKQDAEKLEGLCKGPNGEFKLAGNVNDPKVRFSYSIDYNGTTYTLYYSGTLDQEAKAITGTIEVAGTSGSFSAKKDK